MRLKDGDEGVIEVVRRWGLQMRLWRAMRSSVRKSGAVAVTVEHTRRRGEETGFFLSLTVLLVVDPLDREMLSSCTSKSVEETCFSWAVAVSEPSFFS